MNQTCSFPTRPAGVGCRSMVAGVRHFLRAPRRYPTLVPTNIPKALKSQVRRFAALVGETSTLHSQRLVVVECHDENFGWDVPSRRTLGLCTAVCPSRCLFRRCTVGRSWDHSREIESESLFSSLRWRESHASEFPASARNSERRVGIESGPVLSTFPATQVLADSSGLEGNSGADRSTNVMRNRL